LAFVNTNGFAIGEKAEIYWGMRIYEIAVESGVEFFVWGNLDYALKKGVCGDFCSTPFSSRFTSFGNVIYVELR
jgi:hypothetical protein